MKKGLNRNQLKYIAIIAMIIDHVAVCFISVSNPMYSICRFLGRLTAPIMCYFIAEGYRYTSSKCKYGIRLFIFSIISQFAFSMAFYDLIFTFKFNMIFTLFISFLVLLSYEKIKNKQIKWVIIIFLILISKFSDWGIFAPLWVLLFYIFANEKREQIIYYIIIMGTLIIKYIVVDDYHWRVILIQLGLLLFIPILFLYNGEKGSNSKLNKWFFYIFYPLHLFVMALINID